MILGKYAAAGGAVAIALLWPFSTGHIGESMYERNLERFNTPVLELSNDSYDRGYLGSEAVTRVTFKNELKAELEAEGLPSTLAFRHHIKHGVFGVSSESTLELTAELEALTSVLWPENPKPFSLHMNTKITGATDFDLAIAPMSGGSEAGEFSSEPMTVTGEVDRLGNAVFSYQWPSFKFEGIAGDVFTIDSMSGNGTGHMDGDMWLGHQAFKTGSMKLVDPDGAAAEMTGIQFDIENGLETLAQTDTEEPDVRLNNLNSFKVEKIAFPTGQSVENLDLGIGFGKLDHQSLQEIARVTESMGDEPSEAELQQLVAALDRLVSKGFDLSIDPLTLDSAEGGVAGKVSLAIEPGVEHISENIGAVINVLGGEIDIAVPTVYVNQAAPVASTLSELAKYGFVDTQDDVTRIKAKIKGDKAVSPTGDEVPLALLAMILM